MKSSMLIELSVASYIAIALSFIRRIISKAKATQLKFDLKFQDLRSEKFYGLIELHCLPADNHTFDLYVHLSELNTNYADKKYDKLHVRLMTIPRQISVVDKAMELNLSLMKKYNITVGSNPVDIVQDTTETIIAPIPEAITLADATRTGLVDPNVRQMLITEFISPLNKFIKESHHE
jgi:hypothetical protein